ncbi:G-protein coupled receptor 1 [Mactra antiquata]
MYVNSAGNPIIYGLTSTKFKAAFKKVLHVKGTTPRGGTYSTARNHFNDAGRSRIPLTPVITQKYDREDEGEPYFLVRIVLGRRSRTVRHDRSGHLKVIDENGVETGRISVDSPM